VSKPNQPSKKQQQPLVESRRVHVSQHYEGDLPTPEMLDKYRQIIPDLPQKMIQWVDEERRHRRRMENKILNRFSLTELSRTIAALIGLAAVLGAGIVFLNKGYPREGAAIIIAAAVAIVGIFISRKPSPPAGDKKS